MSVGAILNAGKTIALNIIKNPKIAQTVGSLIGKIPGPLKSLLKTGLSKGSSSTARLSANLADNAVPAGRKALQTLRSQGVDIATRRTVGKNVMHAFQTGSNVTDRVSGTLGNWANASALS